MAGIDWEKGSLSSPQRPVADSGVDWESGVISSAEPEKSSLARRLIGDTAVSAVKGAIGLTEVPVGIADMATGGMAGKALEGIGYRPKEAKAMLDEMYSPEQKAANKAVSDAEGFFGTAKAALQNPSTIGQSVIESAPLLLPGAAIARGVGAAGKIAPAVAGGIGEGVVGAGLAAEQMRQNSEDGTLSARQTGAALASGAGTAAFGIAGGKLAQSAIGKKLGLADVDTALAMSPAQRAAAGGIDAGIAKRIAGGAVSEGVLEELPQSMWEQAAQNYGEGKPIGEGVAEAGAMGALAGGVMGGGFNALQGRLRGTVEQQPPAPAQEAPRALPAPTYTGTPSDQTMAAEVERANQVAAAQANADAIYAERAAFEQERAPAKLPVTGPMSAAVNVGIDSGATSITSPANPRYEIPAQPRGSFSQQDELASLIGQERADVADRRELAQLVGQERRDQERRIAEAADSRRALDAALADTDRRAAGVAAQESEAARLRLLDNILSSVSDTGNPARQFGNALRRAGYRNTDFTERERQVIQRFSDARAALRSPEATTAPAAPNELDAASLGIRERSTASAMQSDSGRDKIGEAVSLLSQGWKLALNKTLVSPTGKRRKLNAEEFAAVREARAKMINKTEAGNAATQVDAVSDQGRGDVAAGGVRNAQPVRSIARGRGGNAGAPVPGMRAAGTVGNAGGAGSALNAAQPEQVAQKAAQADGAQVAPAGGRVAASKTTGEWASFPPESGSLGVPRASMPQIKAEHRGAMTQFMKARGVTHQQETVAADSLRPTQAEFSPGKVRKALRFEGGDRSILVSSDGYVLDGHHQWLAKRENGEAIDIIRFDAPIDDLVALANEFPSSTNAVGAPSAATGDQIAIKNASPSAATIPAKTPAENQNLIKNAEAAPAGAQQQQKEPKNGMQEGRRQEEVAAQTPAVTTPPAESFGLVEPVKDLSEASRQALYESLKDRLTKGEITLQYGQRQMAAFDEAVKAEEEANSGAQEAKRDQSKPEDVSKIPQKTNTSGESVKKTAENEQVESADKLDPAKIRAGYAHRSLGGLGDKVKMEQAWFDKASEAFAEKVGEKAESEEQKALAAKLLDDFKAEYKTRRYRVMRVGETVVSSAVAGRNKFNAAQAGRRGSALDRAEQEFTDWQKGAIESGVRAIRAARSPEQIAAEQQAKADKAAKKKADLHALLGKLLDFKKGDGTLFGKYPVARVSLDKAGYPSSVTVDATDLTDNKFDIARILFDGDKEKLRAAVDEIRASRTAAEEPPSDSGPLSLVDQHNADIAKLFDGELSVDELKAAFAMVRDNRAAIEAELSKFKKDELLRSGGPMFGARYKSETKPEIVKAAYAAMLDNFIMGESISYALGGGVDWVTTKVKALQARVDAATPESLAAYAAKIKANRAEREQRRDEVAKSIADPKTLEDFRRLMQPKVDSGKTVEEARFELTPEQRARFDMLLAEESRGRRSASAEASKTDVRAAAQTTTGDIIETKHTKTGVPLFVVKAAERVDRDIYNEWNANAKRLGGWYSSFRGNGAVPGFQFKTRENAAAFLQYLGGDTTAAKEAIAERRDAFADDRSQSAVERLNEMADRLEERADESLGRERKANTARRARFAASAEAAANSDKALAGTMRNIAEAISAGTTKFLDRVRQKAQVEMMRSTVKLAKYDELRKKYDSYLEQERHRGEKPTAETADYARWPTFTADRSDLARLGRDLLQIDGAKQLGQRILKVADDVTDAYQKFAKENLHKVSVFSAKREGGDEKQPAVFPTADKAEAAIARSGFKGKATTVSFKRGEHLVIMGPEMAREAGLWQGDPDKRITLNAEAGEEIVAKVKALGKGKVTMPHVFESVAAERARWKALGIETPAEFRSALREFIALQESPVAPDRIKQMERAMIGRANDGLDFFPTPAETAKAMIEAAEISEGMAVLEPSAGMGHIAEQIRDVAGVDPDVVEFNGDRRELLEAKGFNVVGSDFLDLSPRGFTYGDVFRDKDGVEGIMRGSGGMGSNRVGFVPLGKDERQREWRDRDELEGVRKNGYNSGYDRIIMNPPFSNRRDAEHVQHAYSLLKPGGRLVAIMGEGVFYGQDRKAQAFREWLEAVGGTSEKLEEGTFLDPSLPVNTGVNARMVVVDKPENRETTSGSTGKNFESRAASTAASGGNTKVGEEIVANLAEINRVLTGEPLAILKTSEAPHLGKARLREWAVGIFRDYGFYANNSALGKVLMDERSVRDSIGHSLNPFKAVAFKAVPEVIENGVIAHLERRGDMDSIYISGPVVINGADDIVTVLVHRDVNTQRMYLHSVTTKESLLRSSQSSADTEVSKRSGTVISGGISKILQDALKFNGDEGGRESRVDQNPLNAQQKFALNIVQKTADRFRAEYAGAAALDIRVVYSRDDIPEFFRPSPYAEGVYHDREGIIYLVASNLPTRQRAWQVLMHEAVGHAGLANMMGDQFSSLLETVLKRATSGQPLNYDPLPGDANYETVDAVRRLYPEASDAEVAQEVLARMAETMPNVGWFRMAMARIRVWLKNAAKAFGLKLEPTMADVRRLVELAGYHVRSGANLERSPAGRDAVFASRGTAMESRTATIGRNESIIDQMRNAGRRMAGSPTLDESDPFAAENARLREQDKSLWTKAKTQLRRYLSPGGLLPQSVFAEKIKRDSEFQAVEFDIRHLIGGLERAAKSDFGVSFDKLSDAQMSQISEALAGSVPAGLPDATKAAAVAMRQYIDGMSSEYLKIIQDKIDAKMERAIETGKASDAAQAINDIELYEKIKGNIGRYVHRSYQAFDDPKWFEKVPTSVLNSARAYLKKGYVDSGETDAKAAQLSEVTLHEILKNGTAYDSMEAFIAESKLGAKDLSILMRRKDVPAEIRALLGEYSDARLNFTKSATKMGRLIWNTRFLDRVRDIGMGSFFFEGKDRPPAATTQIAAEGSEVYSPLNGLWTFPEIAQAFKDAMGKEQMSELYRAIVRANGIVKYGKTVLSPTTAMRNWQSAMFFSLANGHFDLTQMKKSIAAFREQVSQKATGNDLKYLRHLKQLGVVYDTPYAGEMARLLEDAKMEELLSSDKGDAVRWFRKANQMAQGFYAFGDDFWKIIGFENEKSGLMKAGLSLQDAELEAANRIRNTYPTYSMVGRGVQWLSRFPLAGTFVSFPAEIIRTSSNMLRTVASDLKSDNPKLRELGMRRAAGMAFVSAAFWALSALSKAMVGVDDDEEEAIRDLAPEWQKNSTFLFAGRDEKGNLRYFDMSFLDPYGYWKRPITAMMRDQPWEDSLASGLRGMLEPFLGADITAGAIFEAVANQKQSGGKVYKENDGAIDQAVDIADHLRKALQPGFVGNIERITKAAADVRKPSGQPYSMEDELVALGGWRATTVEPKTALYYRSFEFTDAIAEARKTLSDTLRDANSVSEIDIEDAKARAAAKQEKAFIEMRRLIGAAESAGLSKMQVMQTLRLSNVSQQNIAALMQGRVPPVVVTPQMRMAAVSQARTMRGEEFANEVSDRYRMAMGL